MKEVQLTQGFVALVDDEDFERVNQWKWYANRIRDIVYAAHDFEFNKKRLHLKLHQFILGEVGIDHIDNDSLNCQKYNIRKCTQHQNVMNSSGLKNKSSKYKGVHWSKRNERWIAQIKFNYHCKHIGSFKSEIEAAIAYDKNAKELYGEFAYLNFNNG